MNISMFKNFHRNEGKRPVEEILGAMRDGKYATQIAALRCARERGQDAVAEQIKKKLPAFTLSATYGGRRKDEAIECYNAVVMLDIDRQPAEAIGGLKQAAAALPHTLFCFVSPGGNGLKIGVRPAVTHPLTPENHRRTFTLVQKFYEQRLGVPVDPSGKDVGRLCFVSHDPDLYIAPAHLAFLSGSETETPELPLMEDVVLKQQLAKARSTVDRKTKYEAGNRNNYIYRFACRTNWQGIDADDVKAYARTNFADMDAAERDAAIDSAYTNDFPHDTAREREKKKSEKTADAIHAVKEALVQKHTFRYNIVTERVEWRRRKSKKNFQPIDDIKENSLWCSLKEGGIDCRRDDLHAILFSDFSSSYDPFAEYFHSLPQWDGATDYIGALADTVTTTDQPLWRENFRKWLVAAVACATLPDKINHTVLVLCGSQGVGKTQWCIKLVPPELANFRYSGVLNLYHKDTTFILSECFMLNLDEMEVFSPKEMARLKELITKGDMRERRSYGRNHENYHRRASMTASVNNRQVLTDPTGLRRFLCHDVIAVDYQAPIDYTNVYSQANALLRSGFRYWFDPADIVRLNAHNESFRVRTPEEELFHTYFRRPTPQDAQNGRIRALTTSQIQDRLCYKTHLQMTKGGTISLGMTLKNEGLECRRYRNKNLYLIVEKTTEEVDREKKKYVDDSENETNTSEEQTILDF